MNSRAECQMNSMATADFYANRWAEVVVENVAKQDLTPKSRFPETKDGCFVAGTLVWTDKGKVPIEQIKVGDMVLSQPESGGELAYKRVKETFVFEDKEIWRVVYWGNFANGNTGTELELLVTPNHPFWVKGVGWTSVEKLKDSDELVFQDGSEGFFHKADVLFQTKYPGVGCLDNRDAGITYFVDLRDGKAVWDYGQGPLESIDRTYNDFAWKVYNFEVEDFHTYYVGEYGLWVHNTDCAGHLNTATKPAIYEVSEHEGQV